MEPLDTFADHFRNPRELTGGSRLVTVAYLGLVREGESTAARSAAWRSVCSILPWEDQREGRAGAVAGVVAPAVDVALELGAITEVER